MPKVHFLIPFQLLAKELEIKEFLPAYMDPNLQHQDLITGVCFASGGSGYDPLTPKLAVHAQYFCSFFLHACTVCVICISLFIIFFLIKVKLVVVRSTWNVERIHYEASRNCWSK